MYIYQYQRFLHARIFDHVSQFAGGIHASLDKKKAPLRSVGCWVLVVDWGVGCWLLADRLIVDHLLNFQT